MRILHLTAGTGRWHCGSCIRDNALVRSLRALGHEADLVPLYLPIVADGASCAADEPVLISGVNAYLQQSSPLFRKLPRWMDAPLASAPILDLAGRFAGSTRPESLGAMTVSMLKGEDGFQAKEIGRLLDALEGRPHPEVVVLSNSLLAGLAAPIRRRLGVPVVCTVQGELHFLDGLDEGRDEAWDLTAAALADCDGLIAVSDFAARAMAERTGLPRQAFEVVHNGIDVGGYAPSDPSDPPVIGFLARMYPPKGVHVLAEAFLRLRAQGRDVRLRMGGTLNPGDKPDLREALGRIEAGGHLDAVSVHPNLTAVEKRAFLRELTVFTVPATKDETFGQYNLEAMAAGVPVVAPDRGALPEVIGATGGGVLVPPGDLEALTATLGALLDDADRRLHLGRTGAAAVRDRFTADDMAGSLAQVLGRVRAEAAA